MLPLAQSRHAETDDAGSVRHGADDGYIPAERVLNMTRGNRCCHGNHKLLRPNLWADFFHHALHRLRLHTDKYDVGVACGGGVVGTDGNAEFLRKRPGTLFMLHGGARQRAREQILFQESLY